MIGVDTGVHAGWFDLTTGKAGAFDLTVLKDRDGIYAAVRRAQALANLIGSIPGPVAIDVPVAVKGHGHTFGLQCALFGALSVALTRDHDEVYPVKGTEARRILGVGRGKAAMIEWATLNGAGDRLEDFVGCAWKHETVAEAYMLAKAAVILFGEGLRRTETGLVPTSTTLSQRRLP